MWAIRRSSNPIRSQSCCILFNHTFYAKSGVPINLKKGFQYSEGCLINGAYYVPKLISHRNCWPAIPLALGRSFSFSTETTSIGSEDVLKDGHFDLEMPPETDMFEEHANKDNDDFFFEEDAVEVDGDVADEDTFGFLKAEIDGEKEPAKKIRNSQLYKVIMATPRSSLNHALDQWVRGNSFGEGEVSFILWNLRKLRIYGKALQFMDWLEQNKCLDYKESHYATRLDLVAKVHGIPMAESYLTKVPKSFKGEELYGTLLANWVASYNVKKAEEAFDKMRKLGFPLSAFPFNQLILLYKRTDRKKIDDVLAMMEKENVKPSPFTYRLLIDAKGHVHDTSGMEDVLATMRAECTEPSLATKAVVARHYIFAGRNEKAKEMLREIEGDDIAKNRAACIHLLPLYAAFQKLDDVERIWNVCKSNPNFGECFAAIEAWGKLGNIEEAELVFEQMTQTWKKLSPKYYNLLLKVYADHKLLSKGKELAKRMLDDGYKMGPLTWDPLVKLHVEAGELEEATSILRRASGNNTQMKALYTSYTCVMQKYADKGDIHNAEKLFFWLRRMGYIGRALPFQLLLHAYVNAKAPAYGFRERMKADNIQPHMIALANLHAVDAFRKTTI